MPGKRIAFGILVLVVIVIAISGCPKVSEKSGLSEFKGLPGDQCQTDADCEDIACGIDECVLGIAGDQCNADSDCIEGLNCVDRECSS